MKNRGEENEGFLEEATLTVWRDAIAPETSAEDSIRTAPETFPTFGKTEPRFRTLEAGAQSLPD